MDYNFKPLEDILENRITADKFECKLYNSDLAPLPEIINLLFKTTPDAVVRPRTAGEISEVMKFANKNKIYVAPRASASSALGGCVPTRGGIVMDMSSMDNEIEINKEEKTVVVSSGVVWKKLEKVLNRKNLALMSYPSSAPSSTVGGWISSPGYGIGTVKYGRFYEQVLGMEIVLPGGEIKQYSGEDRYKFFGMEGTVGIITEAKLKVRELPETVSAHLLTFGSQKSFCSAAEKLVKLNPFNIYYADKNYTRMMRDAERENADTENFKNSNFKFKVLIVFDGSKEEVSESIENLNKIKKEDNITEESPEMAEKEWKDRFNPMRIKRKGPTLLAGDLLVPINQLDAVISKLNKLDINKLGIEGMVVSSDKAVVMPMYLTDERKFPEFIFALRHMKRMNDIAVSAGGIPYGTGIWNSPYISKISDKNELIKKIELKKKLDPNNILNPDKHLGAKLAIPSLVFNPSVYGLAMFSAEIASKPLIWLRVIK